jgi:UDP-N-acetylglucosamine diphosphorylase / glucose-1-phosphate thymidylyltransferase / UDP-N-acetylgalactosamine diphosphorylase / glucosamine-1-phosphate N-acetyltransferase / galactosamine-1-phosphate N-acetyltransferase
MFKPADLFDLSQTDHAALFDGCQFAWDALKKIRPYVEAQVRPNGAKFARAGITIGPNVFIGEGTVIEDGVLIKGPAIIGKNCEIRHNAYIRDHVIIGDGCTIGNSTELKNALLFNKAVAPHFNYIGDSILGCKAHLGAGVILSNFKSLPGNITIDINGTPVDTGLRKFGALLGDNAEIGCNCVLNPGSIIGRGSVVYGGTNWRGILPANMIVKNKAAQEIVVLRVRET